MEKEKRSRVPIILLIISNIVLCIALAIVIVLFLGRIDGDKITTVGGDLPPNNMGENQEESIALETFKNQAQRYNVSAEFLQSFFTDKIVYKDTEGIIYSPIDPELPKHNYNWGNLVSQNGRLKYIEEGVSKAAVGIDISKYQGKIDWEKVKADGIEYAIIRIGYRGYDTGKLMLDEYFEENIKNATEADMEIGLYFFSQAISPEEAIEEAQFIFDNIKGYEIAYPIIIDIEDVPSTARTSHMTVDDFTDSTIAFCEAVENAGYTPMIYANTKYYVARLDMSRLTKYDKWLAQYYSTPFFPYDFHMWQYTAKGKVNGIKGDVDLNLSFKDYSSKSGTKSSSSQNTSNAG